MRGVKAKVLHTLLAAVLVGVVLALRLIMEPLGLADTSRYLLFALPVVFSAWIGGFYAGTVATLFAMVAVTFFIAEPRWSFRVVAPNYGISLSVFAIQGLLISWLGDRFNRTYRALELVKEDLERRVEDRTRELKRANVKLEQEAIERERARGELQAMTDKLKVSNRELEDFASVASHDLQEPLRKIQAFGDRIEARFAGGLGTEGSDYLRRMKVAAGRMQTLINDLLTFSRVNTKARPFRPTDLNQVTHEVLVDLETRIESTGGRVEIEPLPTIDADPVQMRQLMQNLIGNALKFARPGVSPVVRIRVKNLEAPTAGGNGQPSVPVCQIEISDNGIGFDEKYLDRIFNVFQRLHGRHEYEGTGIGLAVCRRIVSRHGGSITARSLPGEGSTFIVTLPLQNPGERKESHAESADAHHHPVGR